MTKILALSGKKQSGKDTLAKFLTVNAAQMLGTDKIKTYYFANELKNFCRDFLDIPEALLWGTDEDKNTKTHITWEGMPHLALIKAEWVTKQLEGVKNTTPEITEGFIKTSATIFTGEMTVREVLQQVGSNIFRNMYDKIWVNKCIKTIKNDAMDIAVIADMRFPNEADIVLKENGFVLRLTRNVYNDSHISEIALDNYTKFTAILDNHSMTLEQVYEAFREIVKTL